MRPLLRRIYAGSVGALLIMLGVWLAIWALFEYGNLPGLGGSLIVIALGAAGVWLSLEARERRAPAGALPTPTEEEYRPIPAKVAGVTFSNPDGSSRQNVIRSLGIGDVVQLAREPRNKHDANAIRVLDRRGRQFGYVARDLAADLAPKMDAGQPHPATVLQVLNGDPDNLGVTIRIMTPRNW